MSRNGSRKSQQKKRENVRLLKLITLGDRLCGKSCFIKRFCEKKFENKYLPTIGVDYGVKKIKSGSNTLSLNIFDTSGDPVYASLRREFYDNTNVRINSLGWRDLLVSQSCALLKSQTIFHIPFIRVREIWGWIIHLSFESDLFLERGMILSKDLSSISQLAGPELDTVSQSP